MTIRNLGLQRLAVASAITLSFSATAFAVSPAPCDQVTATNEQHIENGLAETCNYFSVCSTGDNQVIGYSWTSSSTETTLYTDGSGNGFKEEPEQCKVIDPTSCPTTEETLASLKEKGLAENCSSYSICSTGDGAALGYSWMAAYSKAEVYIGSDDLGYSSDPKNCGEIEPIVDLALTANTISKDVISGEIVTVTVDVENIGSVDSTETAIIEAHVALTDGCSEADCGPSGSLTILEVDSTDANCDTDGYYLSCSAAPIAAGTKVSLDIVARASGKGPVLLDLNASADDDADTINNNTYINFEVSEKGNDDEEVSYIEPAMNIISGSEMPNTENSAFTSDGSLYVAQASFGGSIYKVFRDANGKYGYTAITQGPENCRFTGMTSSEMTLYAACQTNGNGTYLVKVELLDDILEVISSKLDIDHGLANGMAVGPNGAIYISDSNRNIASVIKVEITDPDTFEITAKPWLGKQYTNAFANGIQIDGDLMYLAEHSRIQTIKITESGPGEIKDFYTVASNMLIDDFAITPSHLAVAQIDSTYLDMGMSYFTTTGHTMIIDKKDGTNVLQKIAADQKYQPSSVVYNKYGTFGENALFVTDYFTGGLYLIEADQEVYILD